MLYKMYLMRLGLWKYKILFKFCIKIIHSLVEEIVSAEIFHHKIAQYGLIR